MKKTTPIKKTTPTKNKNPTPIKKTQQNVNLCYEHFLSHYLRLIAFCNIIGQKDQQTQIKVHCILKPSNFVGEVKEINLCILN